MIIKIIANKPIGNQVSISPLIGQTFRVIDRCKDSPGVVRIVGVPPIPGREGAGANWPLIIHKGEFRRIHRKA